MAVISSLVVRLTATAVGLEGTLNRAESRIQRFASRSQQAGTAITLGLSAPLAAVGGIALKSATDFESAFAGVRKTVTASAKELELLRSGILRMSTDLPATTTQIAAVAEAAGQLGIETRNILGFTRVMIDLGNTTNLSGNQAATALARLANITRLPQDQFERLGSSIVELGNNLATTEAEIVEFALRIAGAGTQVGLTQAQILSFGAALSSVGINAEAGGTAISRVFIEVANQVDQGGKKLETFAAVAGTTAEEFKRSFSRDAAGTLVQFIEGLGKLDSQGQSVFKVLEDLGLSNIRVRDALLRAANAGDLFRKSLKLGTDGFRDNTALANEAALRYQTFASQVQILSNQVRAVAITFGSSLLPIMKNVVESAKPIVFAMKGAADAFGSLSDQSQKTALRIALAFALTGPAILAISAFAGAIGALLSPVIVAFALMGTAGVMLARRFQEIFNSLGTIFDFFGEKLSALNSSIAQSAAEMARAFAESSRTIAEFGATDFAENLTEKLEGLRARFGDFGLSVEQIEERLNSLGQTGPVNIAALGNAAENSSKRLVDSVAKMQQEFGKLPLAVQAVASNMEDSLVAFAQTGKLTFKDFVDSVIADMVRLAARGAILGLFTGRGPTPFAFFGGGALPGFADGGFMRANRPGIVGERGPEIFVPSTSGTVIPNEQAVAGITVNVNNEMKIPSTVFTDRAEAKAMMRAIARELAEQTEDTIEFALRSRDVAEANPSRSV